MPADDYEDDDRPRRPSNSRDDDDDAPRRRDNRDDDFDSPRPRKGSGEGQGLALASMIIGIISIPLCICSICSLPVSITAIVMGFIAKSKTGGDGKSTTGIICGFISIVLVIIAVIINLMNPDNQMNMQQRFGK